MSTFASLVLNGHWERDFCLVCFVVFLQGGFTIVTKVPETLYLHFKCECLENHNKSRAASAMGLELNNLIVFLRIT